ncbi:MULTISPECIES: hypothetical protein [unclassified Breznakia]|uniref:hypothetical protein n=1 Tax=unclassified Breznakia TaxID=2623764 RepID=UPI0024770A11|nr:MULTISPECIES: hypothetical protein [unclassified Breznakia]MDH6367646.1 hypothetical protein [Breznakia sp. PH1-1]MDH6404761.1 hypothetical protein [Breznakia sp. PF1-11]MDH6412476.1 hypothetical protein [Breznakia sp. PFB1-11]MDH6414836.1 hypothetical protein [Breznakia sp. PFB1-14]MDH6417120.1 hypothetical protein [Breznakia sp. PFB1-4]
MMKLEKNQKIFLVPLLVFVVVVTIITSISFREREMLAEDFYVPNIFIQSENYFEEDPQVYEVSVPEGYTTYGTIKARAKARTLTNKELSTNHNKYYKGEVFVSDDLQYVYVQVKNGTYERLERGK